MQAPPSPHPTRTKLGALEAGRFIAASIVMLSHCLWDVQRYAATPRDKLFWGLDTPSCIAVQYFFVLSGFVMLTAHHQDFGSAAAIPRFWWRRVCRIYPMYWLALALAMVVMWRWLTWPLVFPLLSLAPIKLPVQDFVGPAWSLRYEIAFYIMFGLCLAPRIGKPLLAFWAVAVLWKCRPTLIAAALDPGFMHPIDHVFDSWGSHFVSFFELPFLAGLACAFLYLRWQPCRRASLALAAAGVIGLAACGPATQWGFIYLSPPGQIAVSLALALAMLGLVNLERTGLIRTGALARRLGTISYPLYIIHLPMILILDQSCLPWLRFHTPGLDLMATAFIALVYALATAAAFLIDQPLQRLLRRPMRETKQERPAFFEKKAAKKLL
jgi:peptidoglycan/LPS O-acetylase OafA/YrhL